MTGETWRVLVVDDEPDLRELIRLTLSFDERIEVVAAVSDAQQALVAVRSAERIDLVVLDHCLGGSMTGVEVAVLVQERWPETKVVLFTAVDDVDATAARAVAAVLAKPDLARLPEVAARTLEIG